MRKTLLICAATAACLLAPTTALANTSHAGWPAITGMLLMNKQDQARPLDGRPGNDPFDGTDASYSCDGLHISTNCIASTGFKFFTPGKQQGASCDAVPDSASSPLHATIAVPGLITITLPSVPGPVHLPVPDVPGVSLQCDPPAFGSNVVPGDIGHNELLGGHGNNTIYAGPAGDVIWGDYKPSGDPETQVNHIYGGPGRDIMYAAHGTNYIWTGGGPDIVHAHFGRGEIHCDSSNVLVYMSHVSRKHYKLFGCRRISYFTLGY